MSIAAVDSSPANHDRPLLHPSPLLSDEAATNSRRMRTLLDLLTIEKSDGLDQSMMRSDAAGSRWRFLRERLGSKLMVSCCGITTFQQFQNNNSNDDDDDNNVLVQEEANEEVGPSGGGGMNLAAALAAERQFRAAVGEEERDDNIMVATPRRVSLMRLLEETDGGDLERESCCNKEDEREGEIDVRKESGNEVCCVCMGRKKGAAFIPCGHTYCRVCSRELLLNRGSCPLCNRRIHDILDIF